MAIGMVMKREGFVVELMVPLRSGNRQIEEIEISSPRLEHLVRWQSGEIVSRLALMAELTHVPEAVLRMLSFPDVDRVMFAFNYVLPEVIRQTFTDASRPLITPQEELTPAQQVQQRVSDPSDPRFPYVPGARRFDAPPAVNLPMPPPEQLRSPAPAADESSGLVPPPEVMKAVG